MRRHRGIAEVCHSRGRPLIIDEAWGAHLPFHPDLPTWAVDADADLCVVSVHKMGAGFEQGSVFQMQGDRIDFSHLSACADLLMTTSPNVLLYSDIDGWRRHMVQSGNELIDNALALTSRLREQLAQIGGLHVLDEDELTHEAASHDLDRLQIVIDVSELGISGYQAADWLREHHRLDVGLSDHRRIMATISALADDEQTTRRLLDALERLVGAASSLPAPHPVEIPSPDGLELETVLLPRDAFFGPVEHVPVREAIGRIAAEQITPYPPGIPVIVPGERINEEVVEYLLSGLKAGMVLPDPADPSLETIRVTADAARA